MVDLKMTDALTVPLVGGHLALNFVNTTGYRLKGAPRERLVDVEAFLVWCERAGCLMDVSREHTAANDGAIAEIRRIRELLFSVFLPLTAQRVPDAAALMALSKVCHQVLSRHTLTPADGFVAWVDQSAAGVLTPLRRIILSGVELLTNPLVLHIKQCAQCDWMYLDRTKNGSRRWCKKQCGDQVKSHRYYQRRTKKPRV